MNIASPKLDQGSVGKTRSTDPLLIFFTSGTEASPKMVLHSHGYPLAHIVTAKFVDDLHSTDLHLAVADTGWAKQPGENFSANGSVGSGPAAESNRRFQPQDHFECHRTVWRYDLLRLAGCLSHAHPRRPRKFRTWSLRLSLCAGEPLTPEIIKAWGEGTGLDIYEFYGQSETVALLSNFRCKPIKYGSIGLPTLVIRSLWWMRREMNSLLVRKGMSP